MLQLVLVTEAIILSLADVLSDCEGLPYSVLQQYEGLKMSELERKHGLLQVSLRGHDCQRTRLRNHVHDGQPLTGSTRRCA